MGQQIPVMLLCGSTRPDSYTRAGLQAAADHLRQSGADPWMWDPAVDPLPMADPAYHREPTTHPDSAVRRLVAKADGARAFILGTPVYHNSYAGVLKNCLDLLSIAQFAHKPVALLAHGSNHTAVLALEHLRSVIRGLYGLTIPWQVVTTPEEFTPSPTGHRLAGTESVKRLERMVEQLLHYT